MAVGDFDIRAQAALAALPDFVADVNEQTPEGILRAILAEVRGLREELDLARRGMPPRPPGEGWAILYDAQGNPKRWFKRPAEWGSDDRDAPQALGPSDE